MKHSRQYRKPKEDSTIWGAPIKWLDNLASRLVHFFSFSDNAQKQINPSPVKNVPKAVYLHEGEIIDLRTDDGVIRKFKIIKKVAQGGYGSIFHVKNESGEYALKILDLWQKFPSEWGSLIKRFENSFGISKINHKNVAKYHAKGMYEANPFLLMEWCSGGDLENKMETGYFQNVNNFMPAAVQILNGLKELHLNRIIHRDLKPKNILYGKGGDLKITDFELSAFLNTRQTVTNSKAQPELWFSPIYAPPEQTDPDKAYKGARPAMDMFSFAVSMYEILANVSVKDRLFPWGKGEEYLADPDAYFEKVEKNQFVSIGDIRKDLPHEWVVAIDQCLRHEPSERIQSAQKFLSIVGDDPAPIPIEKKQWYLEYKDGCSDKGNRVQLSILFKNKKTGYLTIGRYEPDNENHVDIPIKERTNGDFCFVSRLHATLIRDGKSLKIRDGYRPGGKGTRKWNKSRNGTFVVKNQSFEKIKLNEKKPFGLEEGDTVILAENVKFIIGKN